MKKILSAIICTFFLVVAYGQQFEDSHKLDPEERMINVSTATLVAVSDLDLLISNFEPENKNATGDQTPLTFNLTIDNDESSVNKYEGSVSFNIYYSTDEILDEDDYLRVIGSQEVGISNTVSVTFPFSPRPEGENFIICEVDPANSVNEANEGNNVAVTSFYVTDSPFNDNYDIVRPDYDIESNIEYEDQKLVATRNIGDIDADGFEDIGVLYGKTLEIWTNDVELKNSFAFNNASFLATRVIGTGYLNKDDTPDVFVAYEEQNSGPTYSKIAVFNGKKNFSSNTLIPDEVINITEEADELFPDVSSVSSINIQNIGDIDNDGYSDVAISTLSSKRINIWFGNSEFGDRMEAFDIPSSPNFTPRLFRIGDVNGDLKDDLAVSDITSNLIHIYHGGSSSLLIPDQTIDFSEFFDTENLPNSTFLGHNIVSGRFNDDSKNDILITTVNMSPTNTYSNDLIGSESVFLFTGGNSLEYEKAIRLPAEAFGVSDRFFLHSFVGDVFNIGDINGNGFDNVVFTSFPGASEYERNAIIIDMEDFSEENVPWKVLQSPNIESMGIDQNSVSDQRSNAIGDFDRDGNLEMLLPERFSNTLYAYQIGASNSPPEIEDQSFSAPSNAPNGFEIGEILASDDEDTQLAFDVIAGNDDDIFMVLEDSGELLINQTPDFAKSNSYDLLVKVSDSNGGFALAIVTIVEGDPILSVADINSSIYPNPTQDFVSIVDHKFQPIDVINNEGKIVIKSADVDISGRIDLRQLAPGTYYLKVEKSIFRIIKK